MIKRLTGRSWLGLSSMLHLYFSNTSQKGLVPLPKEHPQNFYKSIYGIQMKKHILPLNLYSFPWKAEDMKEYRKKMPTYVVILVSKVLETAEEFPIKEELKQKPAIEKFYQIATYCRIKYLKKQTEIEGLFRVNINTINQTDQYESQNNKEVEIIEAQDQQDEQQAKQQNPIQLSPESQSRQIAFQTHSQKLNLKLYSLQVDRMDQAKIVLDHNKQIQLKFLIQTHKLFYPSNGKNKFLLFNPGQFLRNIYVIAQQMSIENNNKVKEIQEILEENDEENKMNLTLEIMKKTLDWKSIYKNIQQIAESNLKNRKFYQYYSQILKIAKQSIEGKKGKQLFLQKVTKRFHEQKPPNIVKQVFNQEKQKYLVMDESSFQSAVVKKYLQDLSLIPYSIKSQELYDLSFSQKILEQQHYGMQEVKSSILEMIAVGKLKGTLKGKIFCLIGGPGLGKTTIAKSIAKALGRKFFSISLGGVSNSSVLKGHRRTYVGAYAGKIIQALKQCKTSNPVILLDQIDKMGSSYQGDPRSQLLEILDPNQNESFIDNFIDVPIDLSNVLFICSANYQRNISKPLLDRMEKIKLHSYTDDQKKEIFKLHLLRRAIQKTGVKTQQFVLNPNVLDTLIYEYSEGEPGVRRLEKNILQILQKIAFKIVEATEPLPITVSNLNLKDYLGNNYYRRKNHDNLSVGTAISLGGGDHGSRLTYIQSFKKSFAGKKGYKRGVMFTGSLGDIFKQTMNISYTYARNFILNHLSNTFLYQNQIHIHALDGASKKDGSMDSLTICSALVSLALQQSIKPGFAMTGQITLYGRVLRTHGIKEKILLAQREKIRNLIVPKQNKADVEMLGVNIKQGLNIHFVKQFSQVYNLLFEQPLPQPLATSLPQSLHQLSSNLDHSTPL